MRVILDMYTQFGSTIFVINPMFVCLYRFVIKLMVLLSFLIGPYPMMCSFVINPTLLCSFAEQEVGGRERTKEASDADGRDHEDL